LIAKIFQKGLSVKKFGKTLKEIKNVHATRPQPEIFDMDMVEHCVQSVFSTKPPPSTQMKRACCKLSRTTTPT
jgi:hypothetical protein